MAGVVGLLCVLASADLAMPYFLKLLVDDVLPAAREGSDDWQLLWLILPGMMLMYATRNALFYMSRMRSTRIGEDLCLRLRTRVFEHLQHLGLRYFRANRAGRVGARVMDDTYRVQAFISEKLPTFFRYVLELSVLFVLIYAINWRLALVSSIVLPLHLLTWRFFKGPIRRSHVEAQENLARAHGDLIERFLGVEVVKGFGAEDRERQAFEASIDASRHSTIRSQRYHFLQKVIADLLVGLGTVLLIGWGVFEVRSGRMSAGAFLMYFWYVRMLYPAVLEVISGAGHLGKARASLDRVHELLEEPASDVVRPASGAGQTMADVTFVPECEGDQRGLVFRDVSFAWDADTPPVLRDITLHIHPGEHVAIVGPSGSGKSTLMAMLARFIDPTEGEFRVDGIPARDHDLRSLRHRFGFVFQELFLFNATVFENLRYAQPDATPEHVIKACRLSGAHAFIERLPKGYDTRIGENGSVLSRGERQRLTIARALIREPEVMVIDEATASLDPVSARRILTGVTEHRAGRTLIMVTHDDDLLDLVDRVIRLDDGRIVSDERRVRTPASFDADDATTPALDAATSAPTPLEHGESPLPQPDSPANAKTTDLTSDVDLAHPMNRSSAAEAAARKITSVGLAMAVGCTGLMTLASVPGCVSEKPKSQMQFDVEEPRISGGVFVEEPDPTRLEELAAALDALVIESPDGETSGPIAWQFPTPRAFPKGRIDDIFAEDLTPDMDRGDLSSEDAALADEESVAAREGAQPAGLPANLPAMSSMEVPVGASDLIELPRLSPIELRDLLDRTLVEAESRLGYEAVTPALSGVLPAAPRGVQDAVLLSKQEDDRVRIMGLGARRYASQKPHLWLFGVTIEPDGGLGQNEDVGLIAPSVDSFVEAMRDSRTDLRASDLDKNMLQLSYVDAGIALTMLESMGVSVVREVKEMPESITFDTLPLVIQVPNPQAEATGLIGDVATSRGEFGVSLTPSVASKLSENTIASPTMQLMVLYHPAHPGQLGRVRELVDDFIDRPARQIFVEGMVLEISEEGLKDLGVEWELNEGPISWRIGSLRADGITDTLDLDTGDLDFWRVFNRNFQNQWSMKIRTLLRDKKAEVLSRPSVLTLDNRQSTIRVGRDIPVATSTEGTASNSNRVAFNFKYLPTGILLNIRPRINESGSEVSMLVDTIVSAVVPGGDLVIRSQDGDELASAPTVSTRRVQTYARIRNNTPFIIGGLVSREDSSEIDKVPLLGDIPILGGLFRSERRTQEKREVVIVLTPFILPEEQYLPRSLPKDEDRFDNFGQQLFRDSYRIREADVFDLGFLTENETLMAYQAAATRAVRLDHRLSSREPFRSFVGGKLPGERILVTRMFYEVVKRIGLDNKLDAERVIFFEDERVGGYQVRFLADALSRLGDGTDLMSFFNVQQGKAVVLTFEDAPAATAVGEPFNADAAADAIRTRPVPKLELVDCPDRDTWSKLLWQANRPGPNGERRRAIVISSPSDIIRLRRAIAVKNVVATNGGPSSLSLRNFNVGKVLVVPSFEEDAVQVLDGEVAEIFFRTEHYYGATLDAIRGGMERMDRSLSRR